MAPLAGPVLFAAAALCCVLAAAAAAAGPPNPDHRHHHLRRRYMQNTWGDDPAGSPDAEKAAAAAPGARQYDAIGALYERAKHVPAGLAERTSLVAALPDLRGKAVLDVGSGTGFYCRLFRSMGAARVTGADASAEMIAHARAVEQAEERREEEREERLRGPILYELVRDAARLPWLGDFDVVTAVWLLGYADDVAALDDMIAGLAANLAVDGTLVVVVPNPEFDWDRAAWGLLLYGIEAGKTGPPERDGRQQYFVRVDGDPPLEFAGFSWPPGVVEAALCRAGLTSVRRRPVVVPFSDNPGFWSEMLENPTFAVFTATKP